MKIIALAYIYQLAKFGDLWVVVQEIYSKRHLASCTNSHHDVTDLVNHGMVKTTKTSISWKRNITFLQNKKITCGSDTHFKKLSFSSGGNVWVKECQILT